MLSRAGSALGAKLLAYDNQILGLVLLVLAADGWITLAARYDQTWRYVVRGVYAVPLGHSLVLLLSAVYLTVVSLILLSAKKPLARYETLAPNALAVLAAFGVYGFALLPASPEALVPVLLPLVLIAAGNVIVLLALVSLRRQFTVTPQAHQLVDAGLYSCVRHPMYIGNILSLLGLALLVGTPAALALCAVTVGLQVGRALLEERLLARTISGYAAYKNRVGAFLPKGLFR
jgi:protein-S-isoprenylcysteine O-methyltransferase Ste14